VQALEPGARLAKEVRPEIPRLDARTFSYRSLSSHRRIEMSEIHVTARLKIHAGKLEELKTLAAKLMEVVRTQDSGMLKYDWFLSADQTECVIQESYRDSDAVLEHLGNVGELSGEMMGLGDLTIEAYGSPSAALVEATAALAPRFYSPFQSL
jgi:quinol monooxygenase YgiN